MNWNEIKKDAVLYAGDLNQIMGSGATLGPPIDYSSYYQNCVGLSLKINNARHIRHDITTTFPIEDNTISHFQAEDVFEHIEYDKLPATIDEIYRILKPGGTVRISVPDYRYDVYYNRSVKDSDGNLIFDPIGGGSFANGKVVGGGHVWFPKIENVRSLLDNTKFKTAGNIKFYHYYKEDGTPVLNDIDYSTLFVMRTPDHEKRATIPTRRPVSIVLDATKI